MSARFLARAALAVAVLTGWFLALLWLVLSVSQIAVERVVVPSCAHGGQVVAAAAPGEVVC